MASTTMCRLCIKACQEFKCLIEDNDQTNSVYEIAAKYFDPKFLRPGKEQTTSALCLECWRQINEFHTFQQTVINTQSKLEYSNPSLNDIKLKDQFKMHQTSSFVEALLSTSQSQETSQEMVSYAKTKESIQDVYPTVNKNDMDAFIFKLIGDLECIICNEKFEYYALLSAHFLTEHQNEECNVVCCNRKYNKRFKLVRHIRRIHNGKDKYPYSCEICRRPFMEHCKLKIHHQQVHKIIYNYDFKCEICGNTFQHKDGLKKHVNRRHKKSKLILQWFCNECNRLFDNFLNFEKHTKTKHSHINLANKIKDKSQPLLFCKLCKKMYKAVNYFLDHIKEDHYNVEINSGLLLELHLGEQQVKEDHDIFIIDEIMPEEVCDTNSYDPTFDSQNFADVKYEITCLDSD